MSQVTFNLLAEDEQAHKVSVTTGKALCPSMDEKLFPLNTPEY